MYRMRHHCLNWAIGYAITALVLGVLYRELNKFGLVALPESLGRVHGHLLALGTLFLLILAAADTQSHFGKLKGAGTAFWIYQSGLICAMVMMAVRAFAGHPAGALTYVISGLAGVGHILLAIGLIWLLFLVRHGYRKAEKEQPAVAEDVVLDEDQIM